MKLTWTSETPTVGGWYWVHKDGESNVVEVLGTRQGFSAYVGEYEWIFVTHPILQGALWAGPITPPEEPTLATTAPD